MTGSVVACPRCRSSELSELDTLYSLDEIPDTGNPVDVTGFDCLACQRTFWVS